MGGGVGTGFVDRNSSVLPAKLDLDPEIDAYIDNMLHIEDLDGTVVEDWADEMHPRLYHELFGDDRDMPFVFRENELFRVQKGLLKNLHRSYNRSDIAKQAFNAGYGSVEPGPEVLEAAEDYWFAMHRFDTESHYTHRIPVIGEYLRGREKKEADVFYEEAARRVTEEVGDYRIKVV